MVFGDGKNDPKQVRASKNAEGWVLALTEPINVPPSSSKYNTSKLRLLGSVSTSIKYLIGGKQIQPVFAKAISLIESIKSSIDTKN